MKLSLFKENQKVLLVGEGNFSFAVTLVKQNLNIHITATCYENNPHEVATKNIDNLENNGIQVILGVDATKLEDHEILSKEKFDIVIFNFPHVGGKMRIEKNRELLRNFFMSVKSILQEGGQVFMSLCDGQGGTLADKSLRRWDDSWQVTEMAAHGQFILTAVEPFDSLLFETYTVTGYRSLEKQFHTEGSVVHIFKVADAPNINNVAPKKKIDLKNNCNTSLEYKDISLGIENLSIVSDEDSVLYPNSYKFDITLAVTSDFNTVKFYEILYNHAGLLIDNIEFIGSYAFPDMRETRTFRITYKSKKFPLHRKLVIHLHENLVADLIEKFFDATVSR